MLKKILLGLLLAANSFAGFPPTQTKGAAESSKTVFFNLEAPYSQVTKKDSITALIETGSFNALKDPGFEDTATTYWTASGGSYSKTSTAANVGSGAKAADWDSNASSQTFTSTSVSITSGDGLSSQNITGSCRYKVASGSATHTIQIYDGTNILASASIPSNTSTFQRISITAVAPASGTISLRTVSTASNEPEIFIDNCFLGLSDAFNTSQISPDSFAGQSYFATTASCTWTSTSASIAAFGTTAACPGPTVAYSAIGSWQTTDSDLPRQTINNLPPGTYLATFEFGFEHSASAQTAFAISDGTTTCAERAWANANTSTGQHVVTSCIFTYTSSGNRSFELYGMTNTGTINVRNNTTQNSTTIFRLYRYPTSSDTGYKTDQMPQSWSGYHDNTCSWSRTSTSFGDPTADTTCTFTERTNRNFGTVTSYLSGSDKLPGIVFTPSRAGRYFVCAMVNAESGGTPNAVAKLWDGTTVIGEGQWEFSAANTTIAVPICGIYNATSTSAVTLSLQTKSSSNTMLIAAQSNGAYAVEWSIAALDQSFPASVLVGSVTSQSTGTERIERALLNCDSSSAILSQSGSWVSSIGNISSGKCTVTIAASIFSATPTCVVSLDNATTDRALAKPNPTSSTSLTLTLVTDAGTAGTAGDVHVICMGPR